jgi:hypothetical protein
MKDIRGAAKREREFYSRANLQQCSVCGRWFCRRKDNVCSISCLEKSKEQPAGNGAGETPVHPS